MLKRHSPFTLQPFPMWILPYNSRDIALIRSHQWPLLLPNLQKTFLSLAFHPLCNFWHKYSLLLLEKFHHLVFNIDQYFSHWCLQQRPLPLAPALHIQLSLRHLHLDVSETPQNSVSQAQLLIASPTSTPTPIFTSFCHISDNDTLSITYSS